ARVCITEAAIDAMSLAAIENLRPDTLYVSSGGGWSPATAAAIGTYAACADRHLVAATDRNRQGHVYADCIRAITAAGACGFERIEPHTEDWNEDLRAAVKTAGTGQRKTGEGR
ncbi:MAG: hypothetical protein JWQ22_924, partial [Devosia sp.]|nr:hypothetical protein [Devosia sp.]